MKQTVEYPRPRTLVLARCGVSDLITETRTLWRESLQAKLLTGHTNVLPSVDSLQADRDQIAHVPLHVIDHAIDASPFGATLDSTMKESVHHEQQGTMMRVRDARPGLSAEALFRVCDTLCLSGKPQGTGLGMMICQHMLERHHGALHLTSTVGAGPLASIWRPVTQEFQRVPGASMRADNVMTDDEPAICRAFVKRLTRQGHHAGGCESGDALLAGLQHRLLDLVLLDRKRPGLSGLDTLKQVRQLAPAAIVIILTAYGPMQDAVDTIKLGAHDFMIKSGDWKGIDSVIARAQDVLRLRQRLAARDYDLSVWGFGEHLI